MLGAGPAGLYLAILLRGSRPAGSGEPPEVTVLERNPPDATFGWGVVFSQDSLAALRDADFPTYTEISDTFARWDAIDIHYRGRVLRSRGHSFSAIRRTLLLDILQRRARELGVTLRFHHEVDDPSTVDGDLVVAADGVNSVLRRAHERAFGTVVRPQGCKYVWFGTDLVFDAFTFVFKPTEHGLFQVHAYPFDDNRSTFIVECREPVWRTAGLDTATEADSIAFCEKLFADELAGHRLLSNRSLWLDFPRVHNASWHHGRTVLIGDAAHTAHFSIGSGTKLAMEDAIALADALARRVGNVEAALVDYELERQPVVERFQQAADTSAGYFERVAAYHGLEPIQFAVNLLTRSGRISHANLTLRDPSFGRAADAWFTGQATLEPSAAGDAVERSAAEQSTAGGAVERSAAERSAVERSAVERSAVERSAAERSAVERSAAGGAGRGLVIAPPPLFTPLRLAGSTLPNRAVLPYALSPAPALGSGAGASPRDVGVPPSTERHAGVPRVTGAAEAPRDVGVPPSAERHLGVPASAGAAETAETAEAAPHVGVPASAPSHLGVPAFTADAETTEPPRNLGVPPPAERHVGVPALAGAAEAPRHVGVPALAGPVHGGAGLLLTGLVAACADGRVSPRTPIVSTVDWAAVVGRAHAGGALLAVQLGHAGARGATRPASHGVDLPLPPGEAWPLVAASAVAFTPFGATPVAAGEADLARLLDAFAAGAELLAGTGVDALELDLAHGRLLAGFLSPLANHREDGYGGPLANRLRFPLRVVEAVRAAWPSQRPLLARLTVADWPGGRRPGLTVAEGIEVAMALAAAGVQMIHVEAGQSVAEEQPLYRRGFLTELSDRVRNEAGVPTMVGGHLTTIDEANTALAAGRADLCLLALPEWDGGWDWDGGPG